MRSAEGVPVLKENEWSGTLFKRLKTVMPVGARLAGEGVLENAFAGKPGSYEKAGQAPSPQRIQSSRTTRNPSQSPLLVGRLLLRLPERENTGASPQSLPRMTWRLQFCSSHGLPSLGTPT